MKWRATFFKSGDGVAEVYCQSKAIWRARSGKAVRSWGDVCKSWKEQEVMAGDPCFSAVA